MRAQSSSTRQFKVNRILVLGLACIVLLNPILTISLLWAMRYDTAREATIRDQYYPALTLAKQLRTAVADQQSGLRGFMITRDERFLVTYTDGRAAYLDARDQLLAQAAIDAGTTQLLAEQIAIGDAWHAEVAIPELEAARAGTLTPEQELATLEESSRRLVTFRALNSAYQDAIQARIDDTSRALSDRREAMFAAALGGGLLALVVTIATSVWIVRMIRSPLGILTGVAAAVDAGETQRRVPLLAAAEFDQLGQGMNRMLDSLEQKVDAAEVQRSRFATILESANDGIVVVDPDGCVTDINPAAARMFNTTASDVVGSPAADLGLLNAEEVRRGMSRPRAGGTPPIVRRRGERVLSATISPLRSADEEDSRLGAVWVLRDVTELARIDEMKNEFVSIVSHELRTPLTAIKGFTDLILEGEVGDVSESQREFLEIVQSNSDRLVALINDMLDISRIESGRIVLAREDVDLPAIIDRAVTALRPLLEEKGLSLQKEIDPDLPVIQADEARLVQVFTNLISNACKYTLHGGWVTIRAEAHDSQISVSISDTGIGIPPEALPQLFSKFYRVDHPVARDAGGTGLGLAITKSLIEMHGGRINIASREGVGTTVRFTLPTTPTTPDGDSASPAGAMPVHPLVLLAAPERIASAIADELERVPASVLEPRAYSVAAIIAEAELHLPATIVVYCANGASDPRPEDVIDELLQHPDLAETPLILVAAHGPRDLPAGNVTVLPHDAASAEIVEAVRTVLPITPEARPMRGRVLVAEDNSDLGNWLRRVLVMHGYEVTLVHDGLAAIVRAIELLPDAVILDANMPKMGALEVLPQLRSNPGTSDIPIIVVSGTFPDAGAYFIEAGASDFFAKPFEAEHLVSRLLELRR